MATVMAPSTAPIHKTPVATTLILAMYMSVSIDDIRVFCVSYPLRGSANEHLFVKRSQGPDAQDCSWHLVHRILVWLSRHTRRLV